MEPINASDSSNISLDPSKIAKPSKGPSNHVSSSKHGSLINLSSSSELSDQVSSSSIDIREDVVARAKTLINDPNWLSDQNLSKLSAKLSSVEDF